MALRRERNAEPIPGYRLISPLGSGGFGDVWKCEAPGGLFKAIKFVNGNLNDQDDDQKAGQEFNALQRIKSLRHPFVLSIERVEVIEGELVIVTELADCSLHDRYVECQAAGLQGIPREELLGYLRDAAEVLDLMNFQHDLLHLDVKPRNLFLLGNRVKVGDFGLVKGLQVTKESGPDVALAGITPVYSSPEAFRGSISRHSDQYSLAIVFMELLTGSRPFDGKNGRQLAVQHTQYEPDLGSLGENDRAVVYRGLSKNPDDRFPSCLAMVRSLYDSGPSEGNDRQWNRNPRDEFLLHVDDSSNNSRSHSHESIEKTCVSQAWNDNGELRPTLVIGLGSFGLSALQGLRCRIIERFGALSKLPIVRFLYLDTDQKRMEEAMRGPPEEAMGQNEVFHLPIQGIGSYRRNRQLLDSLTQWLPLEKLYALPRSLETNGMRAVGRLAFNDGYLRLLGRLRRDLRLSHNQANIDESVNKSGLAMQSSAPQVFVIAAACGGSGSGMLLDLAYTIKRLLLEQGALTDDVHLFLQCGAPNDPATPPEELANLYATLTEIHHYTDANVEFHAQYGLNGPTVDDRSAPFRSVYLVKMGHRSPDLLQESASRIGTYLFHNLTTPLGSRLTHSRNAQALRREGIFRSFGMHALWYPRGLVLRVAGRWACQRIIHSWVSELRSEVALSPEKGRFLSRKEYVQSMSRPGGKIGATATLEPEHGNRGKNDGLGLRFKEEEIRGLTKEWMQQDIWKFEVLRQKIEQATVSPNEGTPAQALTAFLSQLESQIDLAIARDDPAAWCRQALERLREWVGSGLSAMEETSDWRKSKLHRSFATGVQKVVDEYSEQLVKSVQVLIDFPGYRLSAGTQAFDSLVRLCEEFGLQQQVSFKAQARQSEQAWQLVDQAVEACLRPGSFVLFVGNRVRKLLNNFLNRLTTYARLRLAEESARSVQSFFTVLRSRLSELQRDLGFCQQRLRYVATSMVASPELLETKLGEDFIDPQLSFVPPPTASQQLVQTAQSLASKIVLPEGSSSVELAASRFLNELGSEQWWLLDQYLQENVLKPRGGLYAICMNSNDLLRSLGSPMLEGAVEYLGTLMPVTDVCQAELAAAQAKGLDLARITRSHYESAVPSLLLKGGEFEQTFMLLPDSEAGLSIGSIARDAIPGINLVNCNNETDLVICREQPNLGLEEVRRLLQSCKKAYFQAVSMPLSSPHARCDVLDWLPLDP